MSHTVGHLVQEAGYEGELTTLAGVVTTSQRGRSIRSSSWTLDGPVMVLPENPQRTFAVIQNIGDTNEAGANVYIYLGSLNALPTQISPMGTFQIDKELSWTGAVFADAVTAEPTVIVLEMGSDFRQ